MVMPDECLDSACLLSYSELVVASKLLHAMEKQPNRLTSARVGDSGDGCWEIRHGSAVRADPSSPCEASSRIWKGRGDRHFTARSAAYFLHRIAAAQSEGAR